LRTQWFARIGLSRGAHGAHGILAAQYFVT